MTERPCRFFRKIQDRLAALNSVATEVPALVTGQGWIWGLWTWSCSDRKLLIDPEKIEISPCFWSQISSKTGLQDIWGLSENVGSIPNEITISYRDNEKPLGLGVLTYFQTHPFWDQQPMVSIFGWWSSSDFDKFSAATRPCRMCARSGPSRAKKPWWRGKEQIGELAKLG